jgi:hypothetical protein
VNIVINLSQILEVINDIFVCTQGTNLLSVINVTENLLDLIATKIIFVYIRESGHINVKNVRKSSTILQRINDIKISTLEIARIPVINVGKNSLV